MDGNFSSVVSYITGSNLIATATGSNQYWDKTNAAIMVAASTTGTGSLIGGGSINLADLTAKTIYPFRLNSVTVDGGTIYILY